MPTGHTLPWAVRIGLVSWIIARYAAQAPVRSKSGLGEPVENEPSLSGREQALGDSPGRGRHLLLQRPFVGPQSLEIVISRWIPELFQGSAGANGGRTPLLTFRCMSGGSRQFGECLCSGRPDKLKRQFFLGSVRFIFVDARLFWRDHHQAIFRIQMLEAEPPGCFERWPACIEQRPVTTRLPDITHG